MKKKIVWILLGAVVISMTACGKNGGTVGTESLSTQAGELQTTDTAYGSVALGKYTGLSVEQASYIVSDSDIEDAIEALVDEQIEYVELDRAIKEEDYVTVYMTITDAQGEVLYEFTEDGADGEWAPYELYIGEADFGEELDEKLTGMVKGDKFDVSVTFEEDHFDENLAGQEVTISGEIVSVMEENVPELTEEFIQEVLGYDSKEDMREKIRTQLENDYLEQSVMEAKETLLEMVLESSEITQYDSEIYESNLEGTKEYYEGYMEMFGVSTMEELEEYLGISEADMEEQAMEDTGRVIVISAIAKEEKLEITDEEYKNGVAYYSEWYAYESEEEFVSDVGEDTIRYWILEDKVMTYLYENATISYVETSVSDEDFFEDEE